MIFTFPGVRTEPGVIRLTVDVRVPQDGEDRCALSEPAPDLNCTALTVLLYVAVTPITPKCEFKVEQTAIVSISWHFNFRNTCLLVLRTKQRILLLIFTHKFCQVLEVISEEK